MTRKTQTKTFLSLISLLVLMAVMALGMISCDTKKDDAATSDSAVESNVESEQNAAEAITVTIEITDDKGETTSKEYTSTTAVTLADILKENDLIEGEETEYGLMITTVAGITADYDTDKAYWALYKNGEYMMTGADGETLENGAVYGLVYTK